MTSLNRWKKALGLAATGLLLVGAILVTAPKAQAATAAELQGQIDLLLAQLAAVQGNTSTSCFEFNRDLTVGSTGPDVSALQNYLKTTDHFPFALGTTGYFGDVTLGAVKAWQSSNGLVPAAGYFGPISRARYALLCQPVNTTPTPTGDDDDDDNDDNGDDDDDDDSTAITADQAIDDAQEAIDDAQQEIDDADDDGDDVDDANDLLDDAEAKLDDARDAFDDDDFEEAEKLADDAANLAGDAVDAIDSGDDDDDADSSFISGDAESPVGTNEARADFKLEFKLTAFNGPLYIPRSLSRDDDPNDGSDGFEYVIESSDGDVYADGSVSDTVSASGSGSGDTSGYFKVSDGQTRTFTIQVSLDNEGETSGFYGLQLKAIRFDDDKTAGGEQTQSTGLKNHETDHVFVDGENN